MTSGLGPEDGYTEVMPLAQINRKIRAHATDDEPTGNHVILRVPHLIRTDAQRRDCHVAGLQFGRIIRRAANPVKVKVYREAGYWVHELEEFRIWSAEKEFDKSREYFRDHLLHIYQEFMAMTPGKATRGALEVKKRFEDLFSVHEFVA